jgi:hypothetical protein
VVPGQGLKLAGKGARSNVIFAEDDVAENSKIEDYVTNQREVIARLLPGPQISDTRPTRMPKAGDALGLEITFRSPAGEAGHQRQFYVRRGKRIGIVTTTTVDAEMERVQPDFDKVLASARFEPPEERTANS